MKKVLLSLVLGSSMIGYSQLFDQTANLDVNGIVSNYFTDTDTVVSSADDFIVPIGDIWELNTATIFGFRNASTVSMDSMKVEIFTDNSGTPGTSLLSEIHNVTFVDGTDTSVTVNFTPITLTEGTYWLSATGYGMSGERWNWFAVTSSHDAVAMLIDVDDLFGAGATNWTALSGLGLTFTDLAFTLDGTKYAVGVEENLANEISIFPNPVVDILTLKNVDLSTVKSIKVYNVGGQLIENMLITTQLDLSNLATGSYLVEVVTSNGTMRKQFIKK